MSQASVEALITLAALVAVVFIMVDAWLTLKGR